MKYLSLLNPASTTAMALAFCFAPHPARSEPEPVPTRQELEARSSSGEVAATLELAKDYFRGQSGSADPEKAAALFLDAAQKGNPEAMDWTGVLLSNGKGVPRDEKKAKEWFEKSAELGHTRGMLHLGLLLRQAKDIPLSNEEGLAWLKKASETGEIEATAVIGRIYFGGDRLQPADRKAAVEYLTKAADAGDPVCQNMLGLCFRDGGPVELNRETAKALFRKAALQNNAKAQANLAFELGVGTPNAPERAEGLAWLILSKEQKEITAQKTFGEISFNLPPGLLVEAQKLAADLKKTLPPSKTSLFPATK